MTLRDLFRRKSAIRFGMRDAMKKSTSTMVPPIISSTFQLISPGTLPQGRTPATRKTAAAASTIQGFVHCIDTALCSTVLSFIGQNMGAKKMKRVPRVLLIAMVYQAAASALLVVAFAFWGEALLGIYTQTPEVIAVGIQEFSVMVNFYVLCGAMNIMGSAMRGLGYSLTSMIVSLIGVCGFRVVWVATVFQMPQYHTYRSLLISYPISWTATALIHLGCWCYAIRKVKRQQEKENSAA